MPFLQQLWLVRFSPISSSAETEALPSKVHAASRASSFCAIWSWGWDSNQHHHVLRYNLILSRHTVFFFSNNTKDITASLENVLLSAILCKLGVVYCLQQDPRHPGVAGVYLVTLSTSWDQSHIVEVDPTNWTEVESQGKLSTLAGRKISVGVAGLAPALALVLICCCFLQHWLFWFFCRFFAMHDSTPAISNQINPYIAYIQIVALIHRSQSSFLARTFW